MEDRDDLAAGHAAGGVDLVDDRLGLSPHVADALPLGGETGHHVVVVDEDADAEVDRAVGDPGMVAGNPAGFRPGGERSGSCAAARARARTLVAAAGRAGRGSAGADAARPAGVGDGAAASARDRQSGSPRRLSRSVPTVM